MRLDRAKRQRVVTCIEATEKMLRQAAIGIAPDEVQRAAGERPQVESNRVLPPDISHESDVPTSDQVVRGAATAATFERCDNCRELRLRTVDRNAPTTRLISAEQLKRVFSIDSPVCPLVRWHAEGDSARAAVA